jgi:hypothetical protein
VEKIISEAVNNGITYFGLGFMLGIHLYRRALLARERRRGGVRRIRPGELWLTP